MENWKAYPCKLDSRVPNSSGYISTTHFINGKPYYSSAHRDAYIEEYGEIPKGLHVLHYCNIKICKEAKHLYAGTHSDNMKDRAKVWSPIGELNAMCKLTDKERKAIMKLVELGFSYEVIAKDFGISKATVSRNAHGRLTDLTEA